MFAGRSRWQTGNLWLATLLLTAAASCCRAEELETAVAVPTAVQEALVRSADNRGELQQALDQVPENQRTGLHFLLENMPERDLRSLSAKFLLDHLAVAYDARAKAKWGAKLSDEIFFEQVLPYANVNEDRDDVRSELHTKFWPVVQDVESISVAAARLNREVFQQLNVRYSTKRRRADQGPRESIETGMASCTGLSILLIDACRACAIPARFVGTPLWSDGSGNHSWVEIWDGDWHFTGAAEPTGDALDQAWFTGRASQATPGDQRHGIFAVSFRRTDLTFPLVWRRSANEVSAVDVTERYAQPQPAATEGLVLLNFRALQPTGSDRCRANLVIKDKAGEVVFRGQTNDETHDANDHVAARLKPGEYQVELQTAGGAVKQTVVAQQDGQLVSLRVTTPADGAAVADLEKFLAGGGTVDQVPQQEFAGAALSRDDAQRARELMAKAHLESIAHARQEEHQAKTLKLGDLEMRWDSTTFGDKPAGGHSLYISMHGGGGAPKAINDRQWENQKKLYQLEEGIYVAPRAPTDTWNLWHQDHIDKFFTRLVEDMIAIEGINPDRVYITGYSAGGDGTFQLAPRMADQLAAAAMMAGHPNETRPDGLRNLPFTLHMGANDGAFNRNQVAAQWKTMLADLRTADPAGYEHWVEIHAEKGHWMDRQDAEGLKWMSKFTRNIIPERIVWLQDDVVHDRFYWLSVKPELAKGGQKIVAKRDGNTITIEQSDVPELTILLRDDMVDLDQPVKVIFDGREVFNGKVDRTATQLAATLVSRGDPQAVFSAALPVQLKETP